MNYALDVNPTEQAGPLLLRSLQFCAGTVPDKLQSQEHESGLPTRNLARDALQIRALNMTDVLPPSCLHICERLCLVGLGIYEQCRLTQRCPFAPSFAGRIVRQTGGQVPLCLVQLPQLSLR